MIQTKRVLKMRKVTFLLDMLLLDLEYQVEVGDEEWEEPLTQIVLRDMILVLVQEA